MRELHVLTTIEASILDQDKIIFHEKLRTIVSSQYMFDAIRVCVEDATFDKVLFLFPVGNPYVDQVILFCKCAFSRRLHHFIFHPYFSPFKITNNKN